MRFALGSLAVLLGCGTTSVQTAMDATTEDTAPASGLVVPQDSAPQDTTPEVSPTDASTGDNAPAGDRAGDTPAGGACPGRRGAPGDAVVTVMMGAVARTVRVHAGSAYDPTRQAMLVLNFHGLTSNAGQQELYSGMNALADTRGFVVAYPEGLGGSWNAGQCCGESARSNVDDVAFARAVIDRLSMEYCLDPRRVFSTGMSNGGFLSHRLACELSDRFAAIAPVAGVLGIPTCAPRRPVPVFHFHGTLDGLVPYNGGGLLNFNSVADTLRGWAQRDGCGAMPMEFLRRGIVHCDRWPGCRQGAEVQLCTVDGGGHTWPGAFPIPLFGVTAREVSASELMVDFFERHPMP